MHYMNMMQYTGHCNFFEKIAWTRIRHGNMTRIITRTERHSFGAIEGLQIGFIAE